MKEKTRKPIAPDDVKVEALTQALTAGHYMDRACKIAGISRSTAYRWLDMADKEQAQIDKGEKPTESGQAYIAIAEEIRKAKEAAAHRAMMSIQNAVANGTWQAAAWYLERTDAEHYARRTQITGAESGPVKVDVSVDDVTALLKRILDEDDDTRE
jgi:transposase-like protein